MSAGRRTPLPTIKRAGGQERYRTIGVKVSPELGARWVELCNRLDRTLPAGERLSRNALLVEIMEAAVTDLESLNAASD